MAGIIFFYVFFAFGFGGVCNVVSGEILPHDTKGFIVSLINVVGYTVNFIVGESTFNPL